MTMPRTTSANQGACLAAKGNRKPWRARIYVDGRDVHIGYFATKEEALAAHAAAAERHGFMVKQGTR
jgi:hypothetical protein